MFTRFRARNIGLFGATCTLALFSYNRFKPTYADEKKFLTQTQIDSYVRDGYLVVPRLFTQAECKQIEQQISTLVKEFDAEQSRVLSIIQPHQTNPVIEHYVKHEKVASVLAQIVGAHIPFWDGSVKAFQSMLFIKPPNFPGQAWHQDELYIPTRDRSLTAIWIPLEDANIENGCLWVVPGSHQQGIMYPTRPHNNNDEYEYDDTCYGFDEKLGKPIEMKAGDALFFNGYLLHKSLKNRSARYRKVLTNHYMTATTLFPYTLKCKCGQLHYIADTDCRNVLLVSGSDPYVAKGYVQETITHLRVLNDNGVVVKRFKS